MNPIDSLLKSYIEKEILPRYGNFDKAHRLDHVTTVIEESLNIAKNYPETDVNMVYAIAAYHDTGLVNGRDNHHIDSGKIIMADENLRRWFSDEQLQIMRDAAEDHRASSDH
ncbi:MAG: HD domain-containing protein, partial [Bacteroidales bacterium]|nr:HD domain-containing protein [Bacteroidales bacterium]